MNVPMFEFKARCQRVRANMAHEGIDYLLIGPSEDMTYLCGFLHQQSERLTILIIPSDGNEIILLIPEFERAIAAPWASFFELVTWNDREDPATKLAGLINNRANGKRVALSNKIFFHFAQRMKEKLSGARFVSGATLIDPVRMCKDPIELECLSAASTATDLVYSDLLESGLIGMTELEIQERIVDLMPKYGQVTNGGVIVSIGANGASPHHHMDNTRLQVGDSVVIDLGGVYNWYYSDMTRTAHVGEPSSEFQRVYDVVRKANENAFDAVIPGATAELIDKAARDHIAGSGHSHRFPHRTGHGIGLEVHELPYIAQGNKMIIEKDMTLCIEPGVYLEDNFGIRLEDVVVVTENGAIRLNKTGHELALIAA